MWFVMCVCFVYVCCVYLWCAYVVCAVCMYVCVWCVFICGACVYMVYECVCSLEDNAECSTFLNRTGLAVAWNAVWPVSPNNHPFSITFGLSLFFVLF